MGVRSELVVAPASGCDGACVKAKKQEAEIWTEPGNGTGDERQAGAWRAKPGGCADCGACTKKSGVGQARART